jgi:chromosome segregation ATPase
MIKKLVIGAVVATLGLGALSWAGLSSYPGTIASKVKGAFKKQVPLEFEIERLHYQVNQLVPDMKKHLSTIAEEMVAIENLKEEVADTRTNLAKQKQNIMAMTKDLETGAAKISYGGRQYSAARIREKLNRDFGSYQRCAAELKSKEQLLEAKEKSLEAAREQLTSMRAQKEELEVQVAQLEAELKAVRLAQTRNKFIIDDSALAQCKATLADIRNRLRVEKTTAELHGEFANDTIPVDQKSKSAAELTKEINDYFKDAPSSSDNKVAERD